MKYTHFHNSQINATLDNSFKYKYSSVYTRTHIFPIKLLRFKEIPDTPSTRAQFVLA